MSGIHNHAHLLADWFSYVLMLSGTTTTQAVTPVCSASSTTHTIADSGWTCPSPAVDFSGATIRHQSSKHRITQVSIAGRSGANSSYSKEVRYA